MTLYGIKIIEGDKKLKWLNLLISILVKDNINFIIIQCIDQNPKCKIIINIKYKYLLPWI